MADAPRKRGLGRGLSALIEDVQTPAAGGAPVRTAPVDQLSPNPNQPRRRFAEEALDALAESIRAHGVIQPLIVRRRPDGREGWEIVAGERRWRAAQRAGAHTLPIVERALNDVEVLEVAIIENIQRADLNPIEEAAGYAQLIERFGHTQEQVARSLGKSRSHIANLLRLLQAPPTVRAMIEDGRLSAGHARALLAAADPEALARRTVAEALSVRQVERLAAAARHPAAGAPPVGKDPDTLALEADLSAALGLKIAIEHRGGGGSVRITYRTLDELDGLCQLLGQSNG